MKLTVKATTDITLAQAKRIAETAAQARSETRILYGDKGANAKSLMGVISLAYKKGSLLTVYAEGRDAAQAIERLQSIL